MCPTRQIPRGKQSQWSPGPQGDKQPRALSLGALHLGLKVRGEEQQQCSRWDESLKYALVNGSLVTFPLLAASEVAPMLWRANQVLHRTPFRLRARSHHRSCEDLLPPHGRHFCLWSDDRPDAQGGGECMECLPSVHYKWMTMYIPRELYYRSLIHSIWLSTLAS